MNKSCCLAARADTLETRADLLAARIDTLAAQAGGLGIGMVLAERKV